MKKIICIITAVCILLGLCCCKPLDAITSAFDKLSPTDSQVIIMKEKVEAYKVDPRPIDDNELAYLFCYKELDSEQKRLYRLIYSATEQMRNGWIELDRCRKNFSADIAIAYQALSADHPELFWMPYTYLLSNTGDTSEPTVYIALSHSENGYSCDYLISGEECEKMKQTLEERVSQLVNKASGKSMYETELYFHDAICAQTEYTEGSADQLIYTAYGALINGKAVCEGYSRAMQLLCKRSGIPCALVSGTADNESHMWNLIDPGDGWYHLDLTWDDAASPDHPSYSYFNLNDSEIALTHTLSPHYSSFSSDDFKNKLSFNILALKSDGTSYNYFVHEGLQLGEDYINTAADMIFLAESEGKKQLQFRFESEQSAVDFSNDYQNCVARIQERLQSISGRKAPIISNIALSGNTVTLYW